MTKRDAERIVRVWQRRLGLDHWAISVEVDAALQSKTSDAEIHWDWSYDNASLCLAPVWRDYEDERAQAVIVHELLHLVCRDLEVAVTEAAVLLPEPVQLYVKDRYQHELEGVVDRLSIRLVELGGCA